VSTEVCNNLRCCVLIIYAKKETTQLHKALDIFYYFPWHKAHNTLQKLTKINYGINLSLIITKLTINFF